jgi:hypothetical protein
MALMVGHEWWYVRMCQVGTSGTDMKKCFKDILALPHSVQVLLAEQPQVLSRHMLCWLKTLWCTYLPAHSPGYQIHQRFVCC